MRSTAVWGGDVTVDAVARLDVARRRGWCGRTRRRIGASGCGSAIVDVDVARLAEDGQPQQCRRGFVGEDHLGMAYDRTRARGRGIDPMARARSMSAAVRTIPGTDPRPAMRRTGAATRSRRRRRGARPGDRCTERGRSESRHPLIVAVRLRWPLGRSAFGGRGRRSAPCAGAAPGPIRVREKPRLLRDGTRRGDVSVERGVRVAGPAARLRASRVRRADPAVGLGAELPRHPLSRTIDLWCLAPLSACPRIHRGCRHHNPTHRRPTGLHKR